MIISRSALATFFFIGITLAVATPASALGPNLVSNGNFETASSGNAALPQDWTTDKWGTITAAFTYPVAGKTGNAAKLQVTKRSSGDAKWVHTPVAVTAGATYQYTDEYISTKATNVTVEYKMQNGSYSYVWLGSTPISSTWKTFTKQFTPPAGAVSFSVLHILSAVGTLTIDNVSVQNTADNNPPPPPPTDTCPNVPGDQTTTPCADQICVQQGGTWNGTSCDMPPPPPTDVCPNVPGGQASTPCADQTCVNQGGTWNGTSCDLPPPPPSTNLIANGNLENGTTNAPTKWHADYWGSLDRTFTYPVTGKDGGKAAKLQVSNYQSGDAKWWFDHVPVSSNTIYQFTDDYNATVPSNISIEFKMSDGSYRYEWLANAPATGGAWAAFKAEVTVPVGAVSLTILHTLDKNGTLTIDNVSLAALPANPFAQGMITIVLDDGLSSQFTNARPILNAAGLKASYGIITGEVGSSPYMSWSNITTLKNEGNEIAGHSRTHPDLTTLTSAQAQAEVKGSFDDLVAQGFVPKSFLYPVGGVNPAIEQITKNAGYSGSRGSYWGLNSPTANKYALYDIRYDKATSAATINAWIDQAVADKRWLILELHDVLPSGGDELSITNAKFQTVVNYIKSTGIKAVTLEEGLHFMAP